MKVIDNKLIKFWDFVYPFLSNKHNDVDKVELYMENVRVNIYGTNSLYIHIPFCKTICSFCPFLKTIYDSNIVDKYLDCLEKEIKMIKKFSFSNNAIFDVIAIGGGSPTTLSDHQLSRLLSMISDSFHISKDCEWSVECEAKSFTEEKAIIMKNYGVNRISLGVQTLNLYYRKILTLTATISEIQTSIDIAKKYFSLQNLDFIYGFPGQSEVQIIDDLKKIMEFGTTSIEVYPLEYISCSPSFLNDIESNGNHKQPSLDEVIGLTKSVFDYFHQKDWEQAISYTFFSPVLDAKKRHFKYGEAMYGKTSDYILGLGASSLSFFDGLCYTNVLDIKKYMSMIEKNELPISKARKYFAYERELVGFPKMMKIEKRYIDRIEKIFPDIREIFDLWIKSGYLENIGEFFILKTEYRSYYIPMVYQLLPDNERDYIIKDISIDRVDEDVRGLFFADLIED
ncbi:MAG: radical SAM protein [Oscillospiraceae bacterium]|nr:radical SAM protein [Oscillospiraceae bacterium]